MYKRQLFVLPGAIIVLALSILYVSYQQTLAMTSIFFGVKAAVLAIVVTALWRLAGKILKKGRLVLITAISFLASVVFDVPFPLVILGAALIALVWRVPTDSDEDDLGDAGDDRVIDRRVSDHRVSPADHGALRAAFFCALLWLAPIVILYGWLGVGHIYVQQGVFFSQVAVVTFGGAYAVLSYMAQQTVGHYGWLSAGEMLDGLGMAETTPGPLIMVTQFVGLSLIHI